jgi:hypothetical protein
MTQNPYNNAILSDNEFLDRTYLLLSNKIKRLQEIEKSKKRNKLPLPLLKEKFEITHNIIEAIRLLISLIDFESEHGPELADVYNDLALMLSKANIASEQIIGLRYYEISKAIVDGFRGK